ncbi:MAG: HEAT repeat domain-containing protein [Candidatus Hodarchaeales archaeon]
MDALIDNNELVRRKAVIALGKMSDFKALKSLIVESLLDALIDNNELVRREAVIALGKLSDSKVYKPMIVESLLDALQDNNEFVRREAAMALGEIGDLKALKPLIKVALSDTSLNVIIIAQVSILELVIPHIEQVLTTSNRDSEDFIRDLAMYLVAYRVVWFRGDRWGFDTLVNLADPRALISLDEAAKYPNFIYDLVLYFVKCFGGIEGEGDFDTLVVLANPRDFNSLDEAIKVINNPLDKSNYRGDICNDYFDAKEVIIDNLDLKGLLTIIDNEDLRYNASEISLVVTELGRRGNFRAVEPLIELLARDSLYDDVDVFEKTLEALISLDSSGILVVPSLVSYLQQRGTCLDYEYLDNYLEVLISINPSPNELLTLKPFLSSIVLGEALEHVKEKARKLLKRLSTPLL